MKIKQKIKKNSVVQHILRNTKVSLMLFHPILFFKYINKIKKFNKIHVMDIEESIDYLVDNEVSLSRFGDGEFRWILNLKQDSFQTSSDELSVKLRNILRTGNSKDHVIAIPDVFSGVWNLAKDDAWAWMKLIIDYGDQWAGMLNSNQIYLDANVTRPYIDRKDKTQSKQFFNDLRNIWEDKDVLVVEGELTRFGVGNDLLDNANSVERIICPSINAFSSYTEILNAVKDACKGKPKIVLAALGPTATILCYDLSKFKVQSIDIGHLDIEYEWYKSGTLTKAPIIGKYVNEVKSGRISTSNVINVEYNSQILKKIN